MGAAADPQREKAEEEVMTGDRAANREEAIGKVAEFLEANYQCSGGHAGPCDEQEEAAAIVEMVEATFFPNEVRCRHCGETIYLEDGMTRWRHTNGMYTCSLQQPRPRPKAEPE